MKDISIGLGSEYIEIREDMKKALCKECNKVFNDHEIVIVYSTPKEGYYLCNNCYGLVKGKI